MQIQAKNNLQFIFGGAYFWNFTIHVKTPHARERGRGVEVQARSQSLDPFNLVSDADQKGSKVCDKEWFPGSSLTSPHPPANNVLSLEISNTIRIDLFSCLACMFCFPNRGTRET